MHSHLRSWAITSRTGALGAMTTFLVALHIASYTEVLATSLMFTFVRLFSSMRIRVDLQGAWSRERLGTGWTYVPLLSLRI